MAEYIDKNKIPWVKTDNPKGIYWDRIVYESTIENMESADVVERSKIDKAIEEIEKSFEPTIGTYNGDTPEHDRPLQMVSILTNLLKS